MKGDWLLAFWVACSFLFDTFLLVGATYLVFWKGASSWLFLMASLLAYQPTLYKALALRFKVPEE